MRNWHNIEKIIWFNIQKVQNLLFPTVLSDFSYFYSFTSKNCLKVDHFCTIYTIRKRRFWTFRMSNRIFSILCQFLTKLKANLANFRKFKCCCERNLDHFHFLQFWYLLFEKVITFLERRKNSVFVTFCLVSCHFQAF